MSSVINSYELGPLYPVPGGVLIKSGGQLLGAIGISGDTSDNDEAGSCDIPWAACCPSADYFNPRSSLYLTIGPAGTVVSKAGFASVGEENISVPVTLANYGTILSLNRQNRFKAVNLYGTIVKALDASLIFSTYSGGVYWPGRDRAKPVFIYLRGRLPSSVSVSNDRFRESHFGPLTAGIKRIAAVRTALYPVPKDAAGCDGARDFAIECRAPARLAC
jgi:hypothetical protein